MKHLGMVKKVVSPRLGEQTLMGQPVTAGAHARTIARAAPRRGEHTEEILRRAGHTAPTTSTRMKAAGVF